MPRVHYFAYGSNMLPRQMAERCVGATAVGAARLEDWRFRINKRGTASIERASGACVYGVVWRCHPFHLGALDWYEGVGFGRYRRAPVEVELFEGTVLRAVTYECLQRHEGVARVNYMATAVLPGARAFGLPDTYLAELSGWLPRRPVGNTTVRYRGRRRR